MPTIPSPARHAVAVAMHNMAHEALGRGFLPGTIRIASGKTPTLPQSGPRKRKKGKDAWQLVQRLRVLIAASCARLAKLEAAYTSEKNNVSALQARIFKRLRPYFEERDRLRLVVSYRRIFLETLLHEGEEDAEQVREEYQRADARTQQQYEDTGAEMESKRRLSDEEESELKKLWRVLVKLFHPDRFADDPEKQTTYTRLTAAINTAKDNGDLETLRQIADDPAGYVMRQGWTAIDLGDTDELEQLQKLFNLKTEMECLRNKRNTRNQNDPRRRMHSTIL